MSRSNRNLHQAQAHPVLRSWQSLRNHVNDHRDFVLPLFITNNDQAVEAILKLPGIFVYGIDRAIDYLEPLVNRFGLRAVLLFPVVSKQSDSSENADEVAFNSIGGQSDDVNLARLSSASSSSSSNSSASSSASFAASQHFPLGSNELRNIHGFESSSSSSNSSNSSSEFEEDQQSTLASKETGAASSSSQNPFMAHNEDEDHLLADINELQTPIDIDLSTKTPLAAATTVEQQYEQTEVRNYEEMQVQAPRRSELENQKKQQVMSLKSIDISLIKKLALKDKYNPVLRLIPRLRERFPQLLIICDVCLCSFTSTGHCCLFEDHLNRLHLPPSCSSFSSLKLGENSTLTKPTTRAETTTTPTTSKKTRSLDRNGLNLRLNISNNNHYRNSHRDRQLDQQEVHSIAISTDNDKTQIAVEKTCKYLATLALAYARRGCNVLAPSGMIDGSVCAIRKALDKNKLLNVSILSNAAKFSSAFCHPINAVLQTETENSAINSGVVDRRTYQLPAGSRMLAMNTVARDIEQGADYVIVQPASIYLDIVRDISVSHPDIPIAVFQVSNEYSMLKLAADAKLIDLGLAMREMLTSFRRAGASIIISYFTPDILKNEVQVYDC